MTWPAVGAQYMELYREILRERGIDPGPAPEAFATAGHRETVRALMENEAETDAA